MTRLEISTKKSNSKKEPNENSRTEKMQRKKDETCIQVVNIQIKIKGSDHSSLGSSS